MFRFLFFLLLTGVACSHVKQSQIQTSLPNAIPALHVVADTTRFDLKITKLAVDVRVVGNIATTTFDLTFYNGLDRVLEGEFDFPLLDGQSISRYALEIEGRLREGVVVEKAKARVAFEATVRQNIDPGLVEKTKGANFRTRVYPIPAKGYKRVVIGMEQKLAYQDDKLIYLLPLQAKEAIDELSIEANVYYNMQPLLETASFNSFAFRQEETGYQGNYEQKAFAGDHLFAFSLPFPEDAKTVYTETKDGKTYFFVNGRLDDLQNKEKAKPAHITLLWDISASAEKRNREKDIAFLKSYLAALQNVQVQVVPFHIAPQPAQTFTIQNGEAKELLASLKNLTPEGGTQLGALDLTAYRTDVFLLFSDGLSTFGKKELRLPGKPIIAVNSSSSADFSYLKYLAQQTGGNFIDLTRLETAAALKQVNHQLLQVRSKKMDGSLEEVVTTVDAATNSFSTAGILATDGAELELVFGNENHVTRTLTIEKEDEQAEGVARIWASMQINQLDMQYEKNKEKITALGKQFSIVTQNTSLIVLDRAEDYVEHQIVPPAELQKEYYALLKEKQQEKNDEKKTAIEEALQAMENLKMWWNAEHKGKKRSLRNDAAGEAASLNIGYRAVTDSAAFAPQTFNTELEQSSVGTAAPPPPGAPGAPPQEELMEIILADGVSDEFVAGSAEMKRKAPTIMVSEWKADAPYLKTLDKSSLQNAFSAYRQLKKQHVSQPSFFLDVAKWFYDKGQKDAALLILSNIAEMKLESPELLRMVAYQLLDMEQKDLAVETFRDVLTMREEEPQAYRDLALALNEAGKHTEAIEQLYKIITQKWDDRFNGIKGIALNEMNSIISAHKGVVNTGFVDSRFIYSMPVDVRITIDWNTNDSDIDLWVTDPKKEKCYYQYSQTSTGGRISDDMTQGYGPEEFAIKKAVNGDYVVEANLYGDTRQTIGGPITIRADLYTDFGKPTQQRKRINFRVTDDKEVVRIGLLKFTH